MISGGTGIFRISLFVVVFCWISAASAQDVRFNATVDRNPVSIGEQFTISFTLTNAGSGGGKNLQLPDLSKFHIMAGPNQSSSMQFINGAVSSSVTYSYVLQPKEVGKIVIGPATIDAGGKAVKTAPVTVEVVKGAGQPRTSAVRPSADLAQQIGDNLFLRANVDRTRVFQGEQINLVFKIYVSRVSILSYGIDKAPTYTGFWGEEVELPKNPELLSETINGKQYRAAVIKRVALFPTQSGMLEISPMEVQTTLQVQSPRSSDPFDAFFRDAFGRTVTYPIKSDAIKIKVDPLPSGAPDDFRGAVGQFAMSTSVDKKTTRTNEPINLKITVSGTGNIKLLESPTVDLPTDFEQFSPKVSDNISKQGERVTGSKVFEFLLLPRYPGLKVIKPVTFSYYDLGKREYVRLRSPQIEINVEQGAAAPPSFAGVTQEGVKLLSEDIRFIKAGRVSFHQRGETLPPGGVIIALLLLPLVGVAGAFVWSRQRQAAMLDQASYRHRRALRVAQKGLKQAEYLLKEKGSGTGSPSSAQRVRFFAEVSRALWKYLGDKLNIPPADFSIEGALAELGRRSVDTGILQALKVLLESCDMARFAPSSVNHAAMQRTYEEAKRLIVELERTLKQS
jgi:hypothetical protein